MTDADRRSAAKQFAADWAGRGDEKQETQSFWLSLLQKVYGVNVENDSVNIRQNTRAYLPMKSKESKLYENE